MRLTFLLCALLGVITAAAVTYGYMKPPEEVTAPAKNVPITESYPSEPSGEIAPFAAEMPRFVYDEPLSEQPVTVTEPPSAVSEAVSPAPKAPETPSKPSPSSQPSTSPEPSTSSEPLPQSQPEPPAAVVPTPTAEDIAEASSEHLRELDALIARITSSLDLIAQQALTDYRELPDPENTLQLSVLAARYMPSVYELEEDADAEAEEIFSNLAAALDEIGADQTTVTEAKVKYEAAKAAQFDFYKELAGSLSLDAE